MGSKKWLHLYDYLVIFAVQSLVFCVVLRRSFSILFTTYVLRLPLCIFKLFLSKLLTFHYHCHVWPFVYNVYTLYTR